MLQRRWRVASIESTGRSCARGVFHKLVHVGADQGNVSCSNLHPSSDDLLAGDLLIFGLVGEIEQHRVTNQAAQRVIGSALAFAQVMVRELHMGTDVGPHLHLLEDVPGVRAPLDAMLLVRHRFGHRLVGVEGLEVEWELLLAGDQPVAELEESCCVERHGGNISVRTAADYDGAYRAAVCGNSVGSVKNRSSASRLRMA